MAQCCPEGGSPALAFVGSPRPPRPPRPLAVSTHCVLLYPPEIRRPGDPPIRVLSHPTPGGYRELRPDPQGYFLLRSLGIRQLSPGMEADLAPVLGGVRLLETSVGAGRAGEGRSALDLGDLRPFRRLSGFPEEVPGPQNGLRRHKS